MSLHTIHNFKKPHNITADKTTPPLFLPGKSCPYMLATSVALRLCGQRRCGGVADRRGRMIRQQPYAQIFENSFANEAIASLAVRTAAPPSAQKSAKYCCASGYGFLVSCAAKFLV